jgi:acetyltransferase-like isoleucine patch superfamily enzyme
MLQKILSLFFFRLKDYVDLFVVQPIRHISFRLRGAKISFRTRIPICKINWPHQLKIGDFCTLEDHLIFKYDGIFKQGPNIILESKVFIGNNCEFNISCGIIIQNNCLIASGCKFIDHNHGYLDKSKLISKQEMDEISIMIGEDVWIGSGVIVLKGVSIGKGAVIGAGAVVNRNIPEYEVWAGNPIQKVKIRN